MPNVGKIKSSTLLDMEIVGVAAAEYFSVDGLEIFDHELEKLRRDRRASFVAEKLVVNRVNFAYALHKIYQEQFRKLRYDIFIGRAKYSLCAKTSISFLSMTQATRT